jgi:hypothetical protein
MIVPTSVLWSAKIRSVTRPSDSIQLLQLALVSPAPNAQALPVHFKYQQDGQSDFTFKWPEPFGFGHRDRMGYLTKQQQGYRSMLARAVEDRAHDPRTLSFGNYGELQRARFLGQLYSR